MDMHRGAKLWQFIAKGISFNLRNALFIYVLLEF